MFPSIALYMYIVLKEEKGSRLNCTGSLFATAIKIEKHKYKNRDEAWLGSYRVVFRNYF